MLRARVHVRNSVRLVTDRADMGPVENTGWQRAERNMELMQTLRDFWGSMWRLRR